MRSNMFYDFNHRSRAKYPQFRQKMRVPRCELASFSFNDLVKLDPASDEFVSKVRDLVLRTQF